MFPGDGHLCIMMEHSNDGRLANLWMLAQSKFCYCCNLQVFLTDGYLGIVMEYVNGGDMADLVDTWNARNRRRRPPPGTVHATGTQ